MEGPHERAMDAFDDLALRGLPVVVERGAYRLYRVR